MRKLILVYHLYACHGVCDEQTARYQYTHRGQAHQVKSLMGTLLVYQGSPRVTWTMRMGNDWLYDE